jgi:hypothetical protein
MTSENIDIRTSGNEFIDEKHCFLVLSCVEECNSLGYKIKERIREMNFTYLDQEKKMVGVRILVGEHGCDVKCCPCLPKKALSAKSDAFGDVACQ